MGRNIKKCAQIRVLASNSVIKTECLLRVKSLGTQYIGKNGKNLSFSLNILLKGMAYVL